jgi:hypothetical protein
MGNFGLKHELLPEYFGEPGFTKLRDQNRILGFPEGFPVMCEWNCSLLWHCGVILLEFPEYILILF